MSVTSVCFTSLFIMSCAKATCTGPDLPDHTHALMPVSGVFAAGAILDIVCVPPYSPETVFQLTCDGRGQWVGHRPHCAVRESGAQWWMLLIGLVSGLVIIPCILPRLYFTFIDTSPPVKRLRPRSQRQYSGDKIRSFEMQDMSSGQQSTMEAAYVGPALYPTPLPPLRQRDFTSDGNLAKGVL